MIRRQNRLTRIYGKFEKSKCGVRFLRFSIEIDFSNSQNCNEGATKVPKTSAQAHASLQGRHLSLDPRPQEKSTLRGLECIRSKACERLCRPDNTGLGCRARSAPRERARAKGP